MNDPRLDSLKQCTFITHSFCGSGIQAQLNWVLCFEVSHKAAAEMSARLQCHLRARIGQDLLPSLCKYLQDFFS